MHRTRELAQAQAVIIESMVALTETRDPETGGHIKRTQAYIRLLAWAACEIPAYRKQLSDETTKLLYRSRSALSHDIGKLGVSDKILLKPGPLTTAEFEEMQKHTTTGKERAIADKDVVTAPEPGREGRSGALSTPTIYVHQP